MLKCSGTRCPIRAYCNNYYLKVDSEGSSIPDTSPCELADGLVSCEQFDYNGKESVETLTLSEIIGEYLHRKHDLSPHNVLEGTYAERSMDILTVVHLEMRQDHCVFAVYGIFDESGEEDELTLFAISFVLSPEGEIERECTLPSKKVPL